MLLRLGTRGSALARWQAQWIVEQLRPLDVEVELVLITTAGDRQQQASQASEGQGIFTKEIQRALLAGRIDLAVHSLKDLPTEDVEGLTLAAVPPRGPTADVLISTGTSSLDDLPRGARVGTSSLRRRAQLLRARRDLEIVEIRGNVDTRLGKLDRGEFDALVLAEAGLRRLGFDKRIAEVLPAGTMLPAIGQGALAIEARRDDATTCHALQALDHAPTRSAVLSERAMLSALHGGCLAPIAGLAIAGDTGLSLSGRVLSEDGDRMIEAIEHGVAANPQSLGVRVAERLIHQGARKLIAAARRRNQ